MIVGAIPVLVALIAAGLGQTATRPLTWAGYAVALMGIAFVAGAGGGGASPRGDLFVLGSAVLSAAFIAIQPRLLADRDAAAVTAVQFAGGALVEAHATEMMRQAIPRARALGIEDILLTCDDDDVGSIRTIEHHGGVLLDVTEVAGVMKRRYAIFPPSGT